MSVLYMQASTGIVEIIAISESERVLEKVMYKWCDQRGITPEYSHGSYCFKQETEFGTVTGWLIIQSDVTVC